jgi:hypothetical protein
MSEKGEDFPEFSEEEVRDHQFAEWHAVELLNYFAPENEPARSKHEVMEDVSRFLGRVLVRNPDRANIDYKKPKSED